MATRSPGNERFALPSNPDVEPQLVPHAAASRGLAAAFGLEFRAALLTIIVDVMVFGLDTVSLETLLPLGIIIATVLGFIVYRIQMESGDDKQQAMTKGMIIGLLTAIPAPLSPIVAVPAGLLGVVNKVRRR